MSSHLPVPTAGHERYLHGHHPSVLRNHTRRTVSNSAFYLEPYLEPGQRLLDVGAGPGTITLDFAERLAPGHVTGIDAGEAIVEQATELAARRGIGNVDFRVGDVYSLDFDDDTFDIVHSHQLLQYLAEPAAALRELRRVTKPGGIVAVRDVDYGGVRWYPWIDGIEVWRDLYQQVARAGGGEPDAGPQLRDWALRAGFTEVSTTASIWCFATPEDREWWGGSWAERALHSEFADLAVSEGLATRETLQQIADAWREWIAAPNGVFNMPHNEIIARA